MISATQKSTVMGKLKSLKFVEEIILNSREQGTGNRGSWRGEDIFFLFFVFFVLDELLTPDS
jgi:hypothetical protein